MVSSQLVCGHWYVLEGRKSKRGSRRKKRENKREGKERRKEIEKRRRVDKEIHVIENIFVSFGYIGIVFRAVGRKIKVVRPFSGGKATVL